MNNLVKVPPYSKLNFQGTNFFTQNWCNITLIDLYFSGVNCIDICHKGTSTDELTSALHPGSLPNGSFQAGIFTKNSKAIKLSTCILSCCEQDKCDAVFFYHDTKSERNTCYLIQCNKTYTGSCDPVQKESSSNKTYFVTVRDVGECTVKPVLRGHLWDKIKWPLNRGSIHMKSSMTGQEKGDLLIQVTA